MPGMQAARRRVGKQFMQQQQQQQRGWTVRTFTPSAFTTALFSSKLTASSSTSGRAATIFMTCRNKRNKNICERSTGSKQCANSGAQATQCTASGHEEVQARRPQAARHAAGTMPQRSSILPLATMPLCHQAPTHAPLLCCNANSLLHGSGSQLALGYRTLQAAHQGAKKSMITSRSPAPACRQQRPVRQSGSHGWPGLYNLHAPVATHAANSSVPMQAARAGVGGGQAARLPALSTAAGTRARSASPSCRCACCVLPASTAAIHWPLSSSADQQQQEQQQ